MSMQSGTPNPEIGVDLVRHLRRGDQQAFHDLYTLFAPVMFRYLARKTRDQDVAQDLVQELFVRIWRKRADLDPEQSLKAYLYTAASRLAIDHLRRNTQRAEVPGEDWDECLMVDSHELQVIHHDQARALLASLSKSQRTVFCLSRIEGLTYHEIAELLGITAKTVETHMSRAFAKLRQHLGAWVIFVALWGEILR